MGREISDSFSQRFCEQFNLLPLIEQEHVKLLFCEHSDLSIVPYIAMKAQIPITFQRTTSSELEESIERAFTQDKDREPNSQVMASPTRVHTYNNAVDSLNKLIAGSIAQRASDIHFEPQADSMICRMRIDGVLFKKSAYTKAEVPEVISRIKIMSGLDIAEKRRPQDGRIRFSHDNRIVDIRVSVIPTDFGEKAVLRILDKKSLKVELSALGFSTRQLSTFQETIKLPHGIILVTGPTGSGKTTTLYAALSALKSSEVNISTVEDPIEYNLEGINQTQIRPEINVSFAVMMRALLRQDPNILMVGEIRDPETLEMAIRASLTGHLVLSTLHTNDAVSTINRLVDMGAERSLLASTLRAIIAQRLVRRICARCQTDSVNDLNILAARKLQIEPSTGFRQGLGCERCLQSGYFGRTAVYEVLSVDNSVREVILNGGIEADLLQRARQNGFETMHERAVELIGNSITTPTEVLREIG